MHPNARNCCLLQGENHARTIGLLGLRILTLLLRIATSLLIVLDSFYIAADFSR